MCVFCEIINGNIPTNKVYEDEHTLAFLDLSQTTYGHTLVVPKKHVENFWDADQDTIHHVMHTVKVVSGLLKEKLHCEGMNILTNVNPVAGQSVMHFHVHLIPRYGKDDTIRIKFGENKVDTDALMDKLKK